MSEEHKAEIDLDLDIKTSQFIENMVAGMSQSQAAFSAGLGKIKNSSAVLAHKLLKQPRIRQRVKERIQQALSLTPQEVIGTLVNQMRGDITDLIDSNGNLNLDRIKKKGLGAIVSQMEVRRVYEGDKKDPTPVDLIKVKTYSAQAAASKLADILGLTNHTQRVEIEIEHKEQRKAFLTSAVQKAIDNGASLSEAIKTLVAVGIPAEHLELIDGNDLTIPDTTDTSNVTDIEAIVLDQEHQESEDE